MIVVTNQSSEVTNAEALMMVRACAHQVQMHAAPAWGRTPIPVVFMTDPKQAPPGSWVVNLLDNPDQADTLGWHTEDQGDVIYGRVFTQPVLDNGGRPLTGALSVSSVLSHEVLEVLIDPNVNMWAQRGDGALVAVEVADPVENGSYPVWVDGHEVMLSNFVLPAWFDPQAAPNSQFDWSKQVRAPYAMSPGGYIVLMAGGKITQQFGDEYPAWRKATKSIDVARTARRVAGAG